MDETDILVVGGGPAGMTAAWDLRDLNLRVIDQGERLGGRLNSATRGDYWLNLGAHLVPGKGSVVADVTEALGLRTLPIPGSKTTVEFDGALYSKGRAEALPFILPLRPSERLALALAGTRILRDVRRLRLASSPADGRRAQRASEYMESLRRISFARYLGPLPNRIDSLFRKAGHRAASELEEHSAAMGIALFSAVWAGKGAMSLTFEGGPGRWGELAQAALGDRVVTNSTVSHIEYDGGQYIASYERSGRPLKISAKQVILAVPAPIARRLVDLPPVVGQALDTVTYGPFVVAGMVTDECGEMPWDDLYAITGTTTSFDMMFNIANPLRSAVPRRNGGSLMCYLGGDGARALLEREEPEIAEMMRRDVVKIFPDLAAHIVEIQVRKWPFGNVYHSPGANTDALRTYVSSRQPKTLHLAGDYLAQLGTMEASAKSGRTAAEMARANRAAMAAA